MSNLQRVFYVGTAPEPVEPVADKTLQWLSYNSASGTAPIFPDDTGNHAVYGGFTIVGIYANDGRLYTPGEALEATGVMRILVDTAGSLGGVVDSTVLSGSGFTAVLEDVRIHFELPSTEDAFSFRGYYQLRKNFRTSDESAVGISGPIWRWRLDETSGIVANDNMGIADLEYESDASIAGYTILPSSSFIDGRAKDINGDAARQIYDPVAGDSTATSLEESITEDNPEHYWKLDENSASTTAVDEMGNGDLTYEAASNISGYSITSSTSDGVGFAKNIKPASRAIRAAALSTGILSTSDFTIELAFRIIATQTGAVLIARKYASFSRFDWVIKLDSSDSNIMLMDFHASGNGTPKFTANIIPSLSAASAGAGTGWHWLSIRMDYTGALIFDTKVDNIERSSIDVTTWDGDWDTGDTDVVFTIGEDSGGAGNKWNEDVDEVVVFLEAITDVKRTKHYDWWVSDAGFDAVTGGLSAADFTIEGAFSIDTATLNMYFLGKMSNTVEYAVRLDAADANILVFDLFQSDATDRTTNLSADLSSDGVTVGDGFHWISIRMDHTGTQLLTCEIDGIEVLSVDVSTWSGSWRQDVLSVFTIGADGKAGTNIWNGGVDEIAVYTKAVIDAQRAANYDWWRSGTGAGYTGLLGDFAVGVPAPIVFPALATSNEVAADSIDADTRFYLMTYVNSLGYESAPGPVNPTPVIAGENTMIQIQSPLAVDVAYHSVPYGKFITQDYAPIVSARFYRTNTGTTDTAYQFIVEAALDTQLSLVDDVDNTDLGAVLVTDAWDTPPHLVTAGCKMANGTYLLVHEYNVFMSVPGVIYAFPALYTQIVRDRLVHIEAVGTSAIALSIGGPYLIAGGSPDTMEIIKLPFYQTCTSVRAVSVYLDMVIYPAQDGLMGVTASGQVINLTENIYEEFEWRSTYDLDTLISAVYDGIYYTWQADGTGFAFDVQRKQLQPLDVNLFANSGIGGVPTGLNYDTASDSFYMAPPTQATLFEWDPTGGLSSDPVDWSWESKEFYVPDRSYGAMKLTGTLDGSNTVSLMLNIDGVDTEFIPGSGDPEFVVSTEDVFRLPAIRGSKIIIKLATKVGAPEVHTLQMAVYPKEII